MPNIGDETIGASTSNFETAVRGIPVTMPETGDISSISVAVGETTTSNAHTLKGVLYDTSGNVLGETNTRADIPAGTPSAYYALTFGTPVNVTGATAIILGVASGAGAGNIAIAYDVGSSGDGRTGSALSFPTIDNPTTLSSGANQYSIYATYTATGGDPEGSLIGGKLLRGGLLLHGVLGR